MKDPVFGFEYLSRDNVTEVSYWNYVRLVSKIVKSDGCSSLVQLYKDACLEHDIHCRTRHTLFGEPITLDWAHDRFRSVMQYNSPLGKSSPVSWVRWLAVRVFKRNFTPYPGIPM